jgi:pimeloyl-ACP methyl ester carboxylesterase
MLPCKQEDMPYLIWLPDLLEHSENFDPFFTRQANGVNKVRNVWLLDYRNQGVSDHHPSYDLNEMGDDIVRFMDQNKITMATIGGHGFGAKLALATATNNLERFTGVMCLDGGPLDHTYYEAYQELKNYVSSSLNFPGP